MVLKLGPHWARSRMRHGAELEWQLEVGPAHTLMHTRTHTHTHMHTPTHTHTQTLAHIHTQNTLTRTSTHMIARALTHTQAHTCVCTQLAAHALAHLPRTFSDFRLSHAASPCQVPIYHPTTTLSLVAYTEGRRGRPEVLGKSLYRISNLLVINNRWRGGGTSSVILRAACTRAICSSAPD